MQTVIEFWHIKKAYGDKVILKDLNLSIEKGEFVTIIGSSGCGKTTALKLGTKVLVMDKGEIQQYDAPGELVRHPATDFVKKLVDQERRICHLPEERLAECEFSGAGEKRD